MPQTYRWPRPVDPYAPTPPSWLRGDCQCVCHLQEEVGRRLWWRGFKRGALRTGAVLLVGLLVWAALEWARWAR